VVRSGEECGFDGAPGDEGGADCGGTGKCAGGVECTSGDGEACTARREHDAGLVVVEQSLTDALALVLAAPTAGLFLTAPTTGLLSLGLRLSLSLGLLGGVVLWASWCLNPPGLAGMVCLTATGRLLLVVLVLGRHTSAACWCVYAVLCESR
jgi:hypothetical protein